MKKKTKRQVHKTVSHRTTKPVLPSGRIIVISSFFSVLLAIVLIANKGSVKGVVLGTAIVRGVFNQATISWPPYPWATGYNIYYGQTGSAKFTSAVRNLPSTVTSYTIQALTKGVNYKYQISALGQDIHGNTKEVWFSPVTVITNARAM
jgi:hypothetical protein